MKQKPAMFYVVWALVALLIVLHQDFWFWNDPTLYFGFLPTSLLYHLGLSIAAAAVWWLATIYAWPIDHLNQPEPTSKKGESRE